MEIPTKLNHLYKKLKHLVLALVTKKQVKKYLILFFLFIPPILPTAYWYNIENNQYHPFSKLELRGPSDITAEEIKEIHKLTETLLEATRNEFPIQLEEQKSTSELGDFELKVTKSITEKLGVFSALPYHKVCLINKTKIYINDMVDDSQAPNMGGIVINQNGEKRFYATRGGIDCQSVQITKFQESPFYVEVGHPMTYLLSEEENGKRLRGEPYTSIFATTTVDASSTTITISLQWWVILSTYILLLFGWSFIFFQYEKIIVYLNSEIKK